MSDQTIKKYIEIVNEARMPVVNPSAAPTRIECIRILKDLDYKSQQAMIRRWLDTKKIGPSLYQDLLQWAKSNHWLSDPNMTTEDDSSDETASDENIMSGGSFDEFEDALSEFEQAVLLRAERHISEDQLEQAREAVYSAAQNLNR